MTTSSPLAQPMMTPSPSLCLYIDDMSQPSRAIKLFCLENNIPFRTRRLLITKKQHKAREYTRIHPQNKIPAITDGDVTLFESHTIMRYLHASRHCADHWYPTDTRHRALVDQYLDWHHTNTRYGSTRYLAATVLGPSLGLKLSAEQAEFIRRDALYVLTSSCRLLEQTLTQRPFLCGDEVSIADISAACELDMLRMSDFDLNAFPYISKWISRMRQLPHWKETVGVLDRAVVIAKARRNAKEQNHPTQPATMLTSNLTAANESDNTSATTTSSTSASSSTSSTASAESFTPTWSDTAKKLKTSIVMTEIANSLPTDGADAVKKLKGFYRFIVTSKDDPSAKAQWLLSLKQGTGAIAEESSGTTTPKADSTFIIDDETFIQLGGGRLKAVPAYMKGQFKMNGNMAKAMQFNAYVFGKSPQATRIRATIDKNQLLPPKSTANTKDNKTTAPSSASTATDKEKIQSKL